MSVTTFYPSASAIDGTVLRTVVAPGENLATIRAGAGAGAGTPDLTLHFPVLYAGPSGGGYNQHNYLGRSIILFDTSTLGAVTITAATLSLYVTGFTDDWGDGKIGIVTSTPASNTALDIADYSQLGTIRQATDLTIATLNLNAYNDFTLNATGLVSINKTGITKFGAKLAYDIDNADPGWVSARLCRVIANSQQGANKPKLVVTYTTGGGSDDLSGYGLF